MAELTLETKPDSVTLYLDRAVVRRVGAVSFPAAGEYFVKLEGLPSDVRLENSNCRFRGSGIRHTLGGLKTEVVARSVLPFPANQATEFETLLEDLRKLEEQEKTVDAEIRSYQDTKSLCGRFFTSLSEPERAVSQGPPALSFVPLSAPALMEAEESAKEGFNSAMLPARKERERIRQEVSVIRERLATQFGHCFQTQIEVEGKQRYVSMRDAVFQLETAKGIMANVLLYNFTKPSSRMIEEMQITAHVRAEEAGEMQCTFSYHTMAARWTPIYDIRMDDETPDRVAFHYHAMAQQWHEDEWTDVKLQFSAAPAATSAELPQLESLDVSFEVPQLQQFQAQAVRCSMRSRGMDMQTECDDGPRLTATPGPPAAPMRTAEASVGKAAGFGSVVFNVDKRVTLKRQAPKKVPLTKLDLPCEVAHVVFPDVSLYCFLMIKAINNTLFPLLPGVGNSVYLNGQLAGRTNIPHVSPGETLHASLCTDPDVKVAQKAPVKIDGSRGLLSGGKTRMREMEYHISNTRNLPKRLVVRAGLPQATDDKITVTLKQPPPSQVAEVAALLEQPLFFESPATRRAGPSMLLNSTTGAVIWIHNLRGNEKWTIPYSYEIAYPAKQQLQEL